jgi:hypothetical protein
VRFKPVQITGADSDCPEANPRPDHVAYFLSVLVVSLFVDLQINTFRPSTSHSATESQSFRCSVNVAD